MKFAPEGVHRQRRCYTSKAGMDRGEQIEKHLRAPRLLETNVMDLHDK